MMTHKLRMSIFFIINSCAFAAHVWNDLLKGNAIFVQSNDMVRQRAKLKDAQHPSSIVLSCSDSRVEPEMIFHKNLGDIFVVRVAGEVTDDIVTHSIEYAV